MRKIAKAFVLALIGLLVTPLIVLAALPTPDNDPSYIISVNAYQNVIETGDQFYLIYYDIDYTLTGTPSTPANEAWIFRHINADNTTNAAIVPYAFQDSGYGVGVGSIYFTATDAPTWGDNYSIQITGNPTLVWASGDPPKTTMERPFGDNEYVGLSTAATQDAISSRLQVIAYEIQEDWGPTYELIESVGGDNKLTSQGENYFVNAIENLQFITPDLFAALQESPTFEERTYSYSYSDNLSGQLIGTSWDFTDLADDFGTERMWMSGLFWMLAVMFIIYRAIRVSKGYGHAFLLFYLFLPFGARIGYIPLIVPVFAMILFGGLPVMWYFGHRSVG